MATPHPRALRDFPRVRQSTLAHFADCQLSAGFELSISLTPRRWRADVSKLATSGWTTHRAGAGRVAHAAIGQALGHMLDRAGERTAPETVIDFYDEQLTQRHVPVAETFAIPAHEDRQLRRTLRKWARDTIITIADVYGVEERLEAVIRYPDGAGGFVDRVITGQLDLLLIADGGAGEHATVPDWKNTWKLPPKRHDDEWADDTGEDDALSVEGYFQQQFYALLVFVNFPRVQSVTLREFYLPRSQPREATIWRHQLPDLIAYVSSLVEKFDRCYEEASAPARGRRYRRKLLATTAEWGEPSPGAHCSYCPMALDCPLPPEVREGGAIANPEQAERVAGQYLVARRVFKTLGRSLDTWTANFGPVRVRDAKRIRLIGHVESRRTERPTKAQVDRAILAGRDPRELYRTKVTTRFVDYSPEAGELLGAEPDDTFELFDRAAAAAAKRRRAA